MVELGCIVGAHGIKGWVKVNSFTEPPEGIVRYAAWRLSLAGEERDVTVAEHRLQSGRVLVRLEGCDTRDEAERMIGGSIQVPESGLEDLPEGEYYWRQLIGLKVFCVDGRPLGVVKGLLATGANDVLVVASEAGPERLVPWVMEHIIRRVDLAAGRIEVDWQPDW